MSKRRVSYYYDREHSSDMISLWVLRVCLADVGAYSFGMNHAMKPQRMRIAHGLIGAYDMLPKMQVLVRHVPSTAQAPSDPFSSPPPTPSHAT